MIDSSDKGYALTSSLLRTDELDLESHRDRQSSTSTIRTDLSIYLPPLPYIWNFMHVLLYVLGGSAFLIGSACYMPRADHPAKGAYLFIMGATGFLLSDLVDCRESIYDCYVEQKSKRRQFRNYKKKNIFELIWSDEDTLGACLMALGSTFYFVGCVLFVPSLNHVVLGDLLFIIGSIVIDFAEGWKIYRLGSSQYSVVTGELERVPFEWKIVFAGNLTLFYADLCNFFGVLIFLVGSIFFLPHIDITNPHTDERRAASLFIIGSFLFVVCGFFMFYDYFVSRRPVDEYE